MNWVLTQLPEREKKVLQLAEKLAPKQDFPLAIANILVQRGIDTFDKARDFFAPGEDLWHDPRLLKGMDAAVSRIVEARWKEQKILVYGDYDVDGTTAVSLLSLFLEEWGFTYDYYVPDRYTEGYGVSFKGVEYAADAGCALIISLDCGIKANDKVRFAKERGLDFIICDHHKPGKELPDALAILDPKQEDCPYPNKEITGCGLGLKLAAALNDRLKAEGFEGPGPDFDPFETYCDLAALSIACDIVPVIGENRMIAYKGIRKIRQNPSKGIHAIQMLSDKERAWDISDLVFFIGPRINAAGRLGTARDAVEVLLGRSGELSHFAKELHASNAERKEIDRQITHEALALIQKDASYPGRTTTVLYHPEWHKGVIGIVASRLIERHYRPTIMLTESEGKLVGSARSVQGFNLYEALDACSDHLLQFGGHDYAAGLTLKKEEFETFRDKFDAEVSARILPEQKVPALCIDHKLDFLEIDARLIRLIHRMAPFGPGNREPVFQTEGVEVRDAVILKGEHLRLRLRKDGRNFESIGFKLAYKWKKINSERLDIAFQPIFHSWNGRSSIQLKLKDIRHSNA